MTPKPSEPKKKSKPATHKYVPTALTQAHLDDIDAIAKAEGMSRSEIIRRAIETFAANYKTDQLDQRQIKLEKQMQTMERSMRALLVKSIRLNGQILYFATLPLTLGTPKRRITQRAFQELYGKSAAFAAQFLRSKAAGLQPNDPEVVEKQPNIEIPKSIEAE